MPLVAYTSKLDSFLMIIVDYLNAHAYSRCSFTPEAITNDIKMFEEKSVSVGAVINLISIHEDALLELISHSPYERVAPHFKEIVASRTKDPVISDAILFLPSKGCHEVTQILASWGV